MTRQNRHAEDGTPAMTRRIRLVRDEYGSVDELQYAVWVVAKQRGWVPPSRRTIDRWMEGDAPSTEHLRMLVLATGRSADYLLGFGS